MGGTRGALNTSCTLARLRALTAEPMVMARVHFAHTSTFAALYSSCACSFGSWRRLAFAYAPLARRLAAWRAAAW